MFGCSDVYTFTKNRMEITSEQVVQELLADPNSPWHEYRGRGPITISEPISRGTATGQRNSRTRSRASCTTICCHVYLEQSSWPNKKFAHPYAAPAAKLEADF